MKSLLFSCLLFSCVAHAQEPFFLIQQGYATTGSFYDGTNDFQKTAANPTGMADGKTGTVSFWINLAGGDGARQDVLNNTEAAASGWRLSRQTTNTFVIVGQNVATIEILRITSTGTYTASSGWINVLASWDLAAGTCLLYINDANAKSGAGTCTNDTINYASISGPWAFGAEQNDNANKVNGCMAEIWFNTSFIDISTEANRRKFISATKRPVNLGINGSLPTGSQPLMYSPIADLSANKGSSGNFTTTGALTACSSSP